MRKTQPLHNSESYTVFTGLVIPQTLPVTKDANLRCSFVVSGTRACFFLVFFF